MSSTTTVENEMEQNKKLHESDLENLKQWYSKQLHLPPSSDELLLLFLHSCNYEMELTKTTVENYFNIKSQAPEFFDNRNPFVVNLKEGNPVAYYALLNNRTPEGYKVMILKLANFDPSAYVFSDQVKAFIMHLDVELLLHGAFPGLVAVFDMEGVTLGHITKMSIEHVKKVLYYVQDAMPVKLTGIHYINVNSLMDIVMGIIKPFLKKTLLDMLHIHAQGIESLYDFVPKNILPEDFGGEDFSLEKLHEKSLKILQNHKTWFEEEAKLRIDESKRVGKLKSLEFLGVDGSFKKLNLD